MKIYKVALREEDQASDGFEWFTDKEKALKSQNENNANSGSDDEVKEYEVKLTRRDLIAFLNAHCVYPDNG